MILLVELLKKLSKRRFYTPNKSLSNSIRVITLKRSAIKVNTAMVRLRQLLIQSWVLRES